MSGAARGVDVVRAAEALLAEAGVDGARRDARWLFAQALGVEVDALAAVLHDPVASDAQARFGDMVARRARREPVSHILGRRAFYGREFEVSSAVLDPRPETEGIVDWVLEGPAPKRVLDLGTGSGALLVSVLCEADGARGVGVDVSAAALDVARRNGTRHGVSNRAVWLKSDWFSALEGVFDTVVCNPPYIPDSDGPALDAEVRDWEPGLALFAGSDGLEAYRRIALDLARFLAPGGRAMFEYGLGQEADVSQIFAAAGFEKRRIVADLSRRPRFVEVAR